MADFSFRSERPRTNNFLLELGHCRGDFFFTGVSYCISSALRSIYRQGDSDTPSATELTGHGCLGGRDRDTVYATIGWPRETSKDTAIIMSSQRRNASIRIPPFFRRLFKFTSMDFETASPATRSARPVLTASAGNMGNDTPHYCAQESVQEHLLPCAAQKVRCVSDQC